MIRTASCRGSVALLATLLASAAAQADDLTVTSAQTTAVTTANAANNSRGNITINSGGSVTTGTGTSVTINSANSVTNSGSISSTATTGGVGVRFDGTGGLTGASLVNNATISLSGTGGSGNSAILIAGGPVTGSISAGIGSIVTVSGDNAFGLNITSPFTGNILVRNLGLTGANSTVIAVAAPLTGTLRVTGSSNASTGAGGYGILVTAPITGTLSNGGSFTLGTQRTVDTSGKEVAGAVGIAGAGIYSNVTGGILNDRYYIDANGNVVPPASVDTTTNVLVSASIITTGSAPALVVQPSATTPGDVTIGAVGTGADAYGIVNRGTYQTVIARAGQATQTILIGGPGGTTTIAGGLVNQANGQISASALDATTTAVHIASGATVPAIINNGSITASVSQTTANGSTPAGPGGSANGILIDLGANVASITNIGTIALGTTGAGVTATAIADRSGTVTSITNSGTINITTAGTARAIDLTGSAANVTVSNSGRLGGSVVFGSGFSTLAISGGSITGTVQYGSGGGALALSGTGTFSGNYTSSAPIAVTLADSSRLDLSGRTSTTFSSLAASGASNLVLPVLSGSTGLTVTGAASFTGTSSISLSLRSLAASQNLVVLQAAGGVTTDHLATLVNTSNAPYLFSTGNAAINGNQLTISVARRATSEIGFTPAQAALFNASITALANSPTEASLIANLPDRLSVVNAYSQLLPPSFGRGVLRTAQAFSDFGFGSAASRLNVIDEQRRNGLTGLGGWAQEYGVLAKQQASAEENGFKYSNFGFAFGADRPLIGTLVAGVGVVLNWASVDQAVGSGLPVAPLFVNTQAIEPYLAYRNGPVFVQATGLAGISQYRARRTVTIGGTSLPASASWGGTHFAAAGTVGAKFKFGRLRVTPSDSLTWLQVNQNSYTESGLGAFNLAVASQTDTITTNTARIEVSYDLRRGPSLLRVFGDGGFVSNISAKPTITSVRFLTDHSTAELPGGKPKDSEVTYGGGLTYLQAGFHARMSYDRREASNYYAHSFNATLGLDF